MIRKAFLKLLATVGFAAVAPVAASAVQPKGPKIKRGDTVMCPRCGQQIAQALRDISGETATSSAFRGIQPGFGPGARMRCDSCGVSYVAPAGYGPLLIHTDRGWL